MINIKMQLLQFIYRSLMMGLPSFTYNPLNDNNLIASMQVLPKSTYVNYK